MTDKMTMILSDAPISEEAPIEGYQAIVRMLRLVRKFVFWIQDSLLGAGMVCVVSFGCGSRQICMPRVSPRSYSVVASSILSSFAFVSNGRVVPGLDSSLQLANMSYMTALRLSVD